MIVDGVGACSTWRLVWYYPLASSLIIWRSAGNFLINFCFKNSVSSPIDSGWLWNNIDGVLATSTKSVCNNMSGIVITVALSSGIVSSGLGCSWAGVHVVMCQSLSYLHYDPFTALLDVRISGTFKFLLWFGGKCCLEGFVLWWSGFIVLYYCSWIGEIFL